MKIRASSIAALSLLAASSAMAAPAKLEVTIAGLEHKKPLPEKFAFCLPDGRGGTRDGQNISPAISWSGAPEGTKSYAIIMVDRDVPAKFDAANKKGLLMTNDFPRQDFYHWSIVDIPTKITNLPEGRASRGITKGGKASGKTDYGMVGKNDYEKVSPGLNGGYDGPCPPWNDLRLHNYTFKVYALDVESLNPDAVTAFTGEQAEKAARGHVLASGEITGTFSTNPEVLKKK